MSLGSNFSYNVRVTKRKFNKVRFFTILSLLIVFIVGALFLFNGQIRKGIYGIFTVSPKTDVAVKDTEPKGTSNISNAQTTDSSSTKEVSDSSGVDTAKDKTLEEKRIVKDFNILKSDLENYIKGYQGQYGIYFIDLVNGSEFGINDTEAYFAASTVKVPVNLLLFEKIKEGSIDPEGTMTYKGRYSSDYEGGTGGLQASKTGRKLVIRDLSKRSITVSDNIAVNMLIRLLGKKNYKEYMKQVGGTVVTEKNVSCPKDMAVYMKKVYDFQQTNKVLGDELVGYLENTVFNDRIPKLLPNDVKVAHKIGNYSGGTWGTVINDVGIIYAENPYIISVMSKGINEPDGNDVIANISKKVYDFMVNPTVISGPSKP